ncbi:MAG TPA: hypothetical protein DHU33_04860 [Firmicutes bacterium]|nr:hypothetical protein [Bacillota bacterium]
MNEEYFKMKSEMNDEILKDQFISTGEVTGRESQDLASMYYNAKDKEALKKLKEDLVQMNRYNITPETEQSHSRR